MDSRIKWIDAAKGLGIVLVVMSHAPIDETLKAFLFAFHMPLFFTCLEQYFVLIP